MSSLYRRHFFTTGTRAVNMWNFLPRDVVNFNIHSVDFSRFLRFSWLFYVLCLNRQLLVFCNLMAGMVHSVSGWTRGVQVKLSDPLRTRAIPDSIFGLQEDNWWSFRATDGGHSAVGPFLLLALRSGTRCLTRCVNKVTRAVSSVNSKRFFFPG